MISLDWRLRLRFGNFQNTAHTVYHHGRGDGRMGKWADTFLSKFDADLREAALHTERSVQRQRAIDNNQVRFWGSLKRMASQAVDDINESKGIDILEFTPPLERGSSNEFSILYERGGAKREVKGTFDKDAHTITIATYNTLRDTAPREYRISANAENQLELVHLNVSRDIEMVVGHILEGLL